MKRVNTNAAFTNLVLLIVACPFGLETDKMAGFVPNNPRTESRLSHLQFDYGGAVLVSCGANSEVTGCEGGGTGFSGMPVSFGPQPTNKQSARIT
jgi:hypothetical protein